MSALKHLCDADRHFAFRIVMGFDSPHGGRNRSTEPHPPARVRQVRQTLRHRAAEMSALKHLCDADRHFAFRIVMGFDSPHGGRNRSTEPHARMACAVDAAAWLTGKIMNVG